MPSERVQRHINQLLDQAEAAIAAGDWETARRHAASILALDPQNEDGALYLAAADRALAGPAAASPPSPRSPARGEGAVLPSPSTGEGGGGGETSPPPAAFGKGRYQVKRFLGEGGKKQ